MAGLSFSASGKVGLAWLNLVSYITTACFLNFVQVDALVLWLGLIADLLYPFLWLIVWRGRVVVTPRVSSRNESARDLGEGVWVGEAEIDRDRSMSGT